MYSGKRKGLKNTRVFPPVHDSHRYTCTPHLCLRASNKQNVKRAGRASHIQVGHNNSDSEINPASQADPLSNPISFMFYGYGALSVGQDASPVTFPRPWFSGKLIGLRKFGTDADKHQRETSISSANIRMGVFQTIDNNCVQYLFRRDFIGSFRISFSERSLFGTGRPVSTVGLPASRFTIITKYLSHRHRASVIRNRPRDPNLSPRIS